VSGGARLVMAVDCSTTAAKAVIHDEVGQVVAQAARPLHTLQPRPAWHEQDAEQWSTATQGAIAEAVGTLVEPGRVRAMCITHQRESFVCLDGSGRALRPAILWLSAPFLCALSSRPAQPGPQPWPGNSWAGVRPLRVAHLRLRRGAA